MQPPQPGRPGYARLAIIPLPADDPYATTPPHFRHGCQHCDPAPCRRSAPVRRPTAMRMV
ncbi:hypothetical protein O0544_09320 [Edwardsiella anguillarum]|nr:hypothetical protein [Edwardsiella anguillarum]